MDRRKIGVPFDFNEQLGIVLAFNGEIYNHRELRVQLSDGMAWQTDCDSEVVARAWRRWGPEMLHHFNGMWGMCLVDSRTNEVFLARDRAGEKPLYYTQYGSGLAFASEIKALPIKLKATFCADVEVFEFDCLETTPFEDVFRLGPGQSIHLRGMDDTARKSGVMEVKPETWWTLGDQVDENMTWEDAVEQTQALIIDAVRIRAQPGVPVGVQVSGGLDSAIVQAIAKHERLYTVTFPEDGVDNMTLARLAGGREPRAITFGLADLKRELRNIAYHLDTPATWTAVCQWFMYEKMAADGCVVALSGEGADELWNGYARYRLLRGIERAAADPLLADYRFAHERLHGRDVDVIARMIDRSNNTRVRKRALEIVCRFATGKGLLADAMRVDFYTTMQVLLRMGDKMAARFSIENRAVFFDHRLLDIASRTPMRYKITEHESKALLREVARRLGVPSIIVDEKSKKGLFVPWAKWQGLEHGARGMWDRSAFSDQMTQAWRAAFAV